MAGGQLAEIEDTTLFGFQVSISSCSSLSRLQCPLTASKFVPLTKTCYISIAVLFALSASAQRKVGLVDVNKIQAALVEASRLDSLFNNARDTLARKMSSWQWEWGMRASNIKSHFDGSAEDWNKIEAKLNLELADIGQLNAVIQDSLPRWRKDVLANFQLLIKEKTAEIAKKHSLEWVFNKEWGLYYETRLDLTEMVMEKTLTDSTAWAIATGSLQNKTFSAMKRYFRPAEYYKR